MKYPGAKGRSLWVFLFVFWALTFFPSTGYSAPHWDKNSKTLRAAVLKDFPPLYTTNKFGQPDGLAIDILNVVAKEINVKIEYVVVPSWAQAMEAIRSGKADLIPGIGMSLTRMNEFAFSTKTETISVSSFVRQKNFDIQGIESLHGRRVGVIRQSAAETKLARDFKNISFHKCNEIDACLMNLLTGEVDAVVFPEPVLKMKLKETNLDDKVKVVGKPLMELHRGFLLRQTDVELLNLINPVISKYVESDEYLKLYAKAYRMDDAYWTPQLIFIVMGSILLISIISLVGWRTFSIMKINLQLSESKKALSQSEALYRSLIENIELGISYIDEDLNIILTNTAQEKLLDKPRDFFVGKTCYKEYEKREQVCDHCPGLKALKSGKAETVVTTGYRDDGTPVTVRIRAFPVMSDPIHGKRGFIEVVEDITQWEALEAQLNEEKERLVVTLRSIGDGVIATDIQGNIVLINKVAEHLTGWMQEEAKGRPLPEIFHIVNEQTRDTCENPVTKVLSSGQIVGLANHTLLISKDGTERSIADSGAPILNRESKIIGVVLVFRDVTEQSKTEKELLKIKKLESVGMLAGGIAHDFNNILSAILGNINLCLYDINLGEKTRILLGEAEKASLRARDLTQQLLTFAKGGVPVKKTSSLKMVIKDSADFILHGGKVACKYTLPDDLWAVEIDRGQISQVIQNIVINASNAMPEGGTIHIVCKNYDPSSDHNHPHLKESKYVTISIIDEGVGIPENILDKIFDPYFSTKQEGSGLGLAISQSIIAKHNGHIEASSTLGKGSTFTIYLPASSSTPIFEELDERVLPLTPFKIKVLVMDDEAVIQQVATSMLSELGHDFVVAASGEEAIALYKKGLLSGRKFDLVIMDLTIPGGMGGKEAVGEILKLDPKAKVAVSSGYSNDPIMANHNQFGFCCALVKPYLLEDLDKTIRALFSTKA